ncbi:MAG: ABC transporter permease [Solobacterium sp.]|nr:ABC transporter permease [Solobacterium sp.]
MFRRNIVHDVTRQYLLLNKRRTIISIVTLMLTVVLLTCVFVGRDTVINGFTKLAEQEYGSWHIACYDIDEKQYEQIQALPDVRETAVTENLMYTAFAQSGNPFRPFLNLRLCSEKAMAWTNVVLAEGHMPQKDNEIVISKAALDEQSTVKIGDVIHADCFTRAISYSGEGRTVFPYQGVIIESGETQEVDISFPYWPEDSDFWLEHDDIHTPLGFVKDYVITGFIEPPVYENEDSAVYTAIAMIDEEHHAERFNCLLKADNANEMSFAIRAILDGQGSYDVNEKVLSFTGDSSESSFNVLVIAMQVFLCVLIVFAAVILIRSLFQLSYDERRVYLGMLGSIGATARQKRSSVYYEAYFYLLPALVLGIPLGFLVILAGTKLVMPMLLGMLDIQTNGQLQWFLSIKPLAIVLVVLVAMVTVLLSALVPAVRIGKIPPIEAIRGNEGKGSKPHQTDLSLSAHRLLARGFVRHEKKKSNGIISALSVYLIILSVVSFASSQVIDMADYRLSEKGTLTIDDSAYNPAHDTINRKAYYLGGQDTEGLMPEVLAELKATDGIEDVHEVSSLTFALMVDINVYSQEWLDTYRTILSRYYPEGLSEEEFRTYTENHNSCLNLVVIADEEYEKMRRKVNGLDHGVLFMKSGEMSTKSQSIFGRSAEYLFRGIEKMSSLSQGDVFPAHYGDEEALLVTAGFVSNDDLKGLVEIHDDYLWGILSESDAAELVETIPALANLFERDVYFRADLSVASARELTEKLERLEAENLHFFPMRTGSLYSFKTMIAGLIRIIMVCFTVLASLICYLNLWNALKGLLNGRKQELAMLESIGAEKKQVYAALVNELHILIAKALLIAVPVIVVLCVLIRKLIAAKFGTFALSFPFISLGITAGITLALVYGMEWLIVRKSTGSIMENIRAIG